MDLNRKILSDVTVYMKYSRFSPEKNRRETWIEIVDRNKNMHVEKFPALKEDIEWAYTFVHNKQILPSMRSLQFAGRPIELNPVRIFNCSYLPMNHPLAFSEIMFLLLCGTGVGYSVQTHHVNELPPIIIPVKSKRSLVGDSIEGWSDAVKALVTAYFYGEPLPKFDFRDIRPKGTLLKTSGGLAPGPEPLKDCLHNIQKIFDRKKSGEKLLSLEVHDINCFISDAVLAGGIRRSATIALFSLTDEEMLTCKFGNWYELNPQRARANNSAVLLRHKIDKKTFNQLWEKIKNSGSGEPGFFFTNDKEWGLNPCSEISLRPFQFCNLVTINASTIENQKDLNDRAKAAAIIATLQASYTDFHYLREAWKKTTEKEALIGVSMTGIASANVMKLNLRQASKLVTKTNEIYAKKIGINKAARCTTIKPEGTTSLVLGASSGIHAWHNDYYIRRITIMKTEPIYQYLLNTCPELLEDDVLKPTLQSLVSIPIKAPEGAITRNEPAIELLKRVSIVYKAWITPGHRTGHNLNNISCTVTVKSHEWKKVGTWMWRNKHNYTALSILPYSDHSYVQPPHEDITKEQYEQLSLKLKDIDLTRIRESKDVTNLKESLACFGNMCEIT